MGFASWLSLQLGWVAQGLRVPICEMGQWYLTTSVEIKQGNQFLTRRQGTSQLRASSSCEQHLDTSRDLGNCAKEPNFGTHESCHC